MHPDPSRLLAAAGIETPLVGFYDAPDPAPFAPLVEPAPGARACVFSFFKSWQRGATLHLTQENYGCAGAGRALFGVQSRSREEFLRFLVEDEGLKDSMNLMAQWINASLPYRREHPHLMIGPLRDPLYEYLKSVTFHVTPDQLGLLTIGAQYHSRPSDPRPVLAPFGAGCMQMVTQFESLGLPQAVIGATDIAMRQYLPQDLFAFTVTKPMFERLCALDERSFLYKPFWARLVKSRHSA